LSLRGPTYAAPIDRESLDRGVFLVVLPGGSAKNTPRNRQRIFDYLMEQFEEGAPPFDEPDCFINGLSEQDLIFIDPHPYRSMSKTAPAPETSEQADIVLAATELLELAKLKVALANAYRDAQQYKDLIFKVVDTEAGHLSEEECEVVSQKAFAKTIKALAEARVKVSQWAETASGNHELIINELSFMDEEIVTALSKAKTKSAKAERVAVEDGDEDEVAA
jgi:hypothetical protein